MSLQHRHAPGSSAVLGAPTQTSPTSIGPTELNAPLDVTVGSDTPTLDTFASSQSEAMEEPCPLWSDDCEWDVGLHEILGDANADRIDELAGLVSVRCAVATRDLAFAQERGIDVDHYIAHCEGAYTLAGALEREAARLRASAVYHPEHDEIEYDVGLEDVVLDLIERLEICIPILDDILVLAHEDGLRAMAEVVDRWGREGSDGIKTLLIRADTGARMMDQLVASFAEHQEAYERHLRDAAMDVGTLVIGPLMKLAEVPESLRRVYTLGRAFSQIGKDIRDPWDAVRTVRSIGSAAIGEVARSLGKENPWSQAWTPLSTLITTCQTIVDLGLTGTELAKMHSVLTLARQVRDEYGAAIDLVGATGPILTEALLFLERMIGATDRVDASLRSLEANVTAAGGLSLYDV